MRTAAPASLAATLSELHSGTTTSRALVESCIAAIEDSQGEGPRTFIRRFFAQARAAADGWDALRASGAVLPPLAGVPFSVKDLTDVAGSTTTAGSIALRDRPPATLDAAYLRRLRAAGAVVLGTTNMTEFAMGGLGLNPHYGTPRNPYDRRTGRIPGGSSSGAVVSVADGMATIGIGSDTAGSVRMPAALCGLVGFKPTARRVPLDGTIPLAESLDSIGPIARTVACCALTDAVLAGADVPAVPEPAELCGARIAVPSNLVLDDLEPAVGADFERAVRAVRDAGARVVELRFPELDELGTLNARGGFSLAEGFAWHRRLLAEKAAEYDPIIGARLATGASIDVADYLEMVHLRADLIRRAARSTAAYDAVVMPTVPIVAPAIADFDGNAERWLRTNRLLIRNPGIANVLDRCALSLPCQAAGSAPVGFTVMGETMEDERLLALGLALESLFARTLWN